MNNQRNESSSRSRKTTYSKRKKTLKKKAEELSVLCGVPVGLVCIEPATAKVETSPHDPQKLHQILQQYLTTANLNSINPDQQINKVYETWDSRLDYLPEDSLMDILKSLDCKQKILEERVKRMANSGNHHHHDGLSTLRLGWHHNHNSESENAQNTESTSTSTNTPTTNAFENGISKSDCDMGVQQSTQNSN